MKNENNEADKLDVDFSFAFPKEAIEQENLFRVFKDRLREIENRGIDHTEMLLIQKESEEILSKNLWL